MNFGQRMAALRGGKKGKGGKKAKKTFINGIATQTGQGLKYKKAHKKGKNWIAGAIGKPGALHRALGIKQGTKIPVARLSAAAGKKGTVGREARLAQTLRGFHKRDVSAKAYLKRVGVSK